MRSRTTKAKRRTSAATLRRLKELRRKHGLGEFKGRKASRRTTASRRRRSYSRSDKASLSMIDPFTLARSTPARGNPLLSRFTSQVSVSAGGGGSASGSGG